MSAEEGRFGLFRLERSRRTMGIARGLLVAAAILPWLVPILEVFTWTSAVGSLLRRIYGMQCHQRLSRSLVCLGLAFPVCARCLGIYLGLGLAALVDRPRLRRDPLKAWLLLGTLLLVVDVATEWVGLRAGNAWIRAATGSLLAYGIGLGILEALRPRRA